MPVHSAVVELVPDIGCNLGREERALMATVGSDSPVSSGWTNLDLEMIHNAQAYLRSRSRHEAPSVEASAAWAQFYPTCTSLLQRFAFGCGVGAGDLDDCVQDVWAELMTALPDFQADGDPGRFSSWLHKLAHGKAIDRARYRVRHPALNECPDFDTAFVGREADPACNYERRRCREAVQAVLAELRREVSTLSYRLFHLHWMEHRTIGEIAAETGLTPHQVSCRLHRVKKRFRRLWEQAYAKMLFETD